MDVCCIVLVNSENVISVSKIPNYTMFHENMKCQYFQGIVDKFQKRMIMLGHP